jgi:hypothetical protein
VLPPRRDASQRLSFAQSLLPQRKDWAERRRAASVAQNWAAIRRRALAAIWQPSAPLTRAARPESARSRRPREFHPRRVVRGLLPAAAGRDTPRSPCSFRWHLRRGVPSPKSQVPRYSRVLTDEGWVTFNSGQRGGDKVRGHPSPCRREDKCGLLSAWLPVARRKLAVGPAFPCRATKVPPLALSFAVEGK